MVSDTLDMDGAQGPLLQVQSNLTLDVFGFVSLEGSFSFKKATGTFALSDTTSLNEADYMEVGAHVASAFAGVGGIGFELTGVDFGMVMVSSGGLSPVNYMALKADVGEAGLVGITGLAATVPSLSVLINKTSSTSAPGVVLDFNDGESPNPLAHAVATGPSPAPPVTLDMDGA